MAKVDYLLINDRIKGETADAMMKAKHAMDIERFSFGASQSGTQASGGGGGAGTVSMQDFSFVMKTNTASPQLFLACVEGRHIKHATLICRKVGKEQQPYYTVKLEDLLVSSYQQSDPSTGPVRTDYIRLNFAKIILHYKEQEADGTLAAGTRMGWDVKANSRIG